MKTVKQLQDYYQSKLEEIAFTRSPQSLYEPIKYVLSMGGKRLRPVLMLMAYNLFKEDISKIIPQALGIELYHNFTLLHDDLMDRADMRRNKATVHKKWNDNAAILSGDAMTILAYQLIANCDEKYLKKVVDLFSQTALEICEGQQYDMDFEHRKNVKAEEYMEMIRLKTSVLLACALKMGAILADASEDDANSLYEFGIHMGLGFQLKDDLLDVYGNPKVFGKKIGGDILCNKKTFLLIKAFELADESQKTELESWIDATDYIPQEKINAVTGLYNKLGVKSISEQMIADHSKQAAMLLGEVSVPADRKVTLLQMLEGLKTREV